MEIGIIIIKMIIIFIDIFIIDIVYIEIVNIDISFNIIIIKGEISCILFKFCFIIKYLLFVLMFSIIFLIYN